MNVILKTSCLLICMVFSVVNRADCELDKEFIHAEYLITTVDKESRKREYRLNLLRNGKQVAHRYPEKEITDVWNLSAKNQIKFTRYFDSYQRAIEYEAKTDTRELAQWRKSYSLLPHDMLEKSSDVSFSCDAESEFSKSYQDVEFVGEYLTSAALPKKLTVSSALYTETWNLVELTHAKNAIQNIFNDLSAYKSTDYADIGDNEDDPFLRQMINLGFVAEGSSGYYDSQGNALESTHKH